jgi:hypothetical protein
MIPRRALQTLALAAAAVATGALTGCGDRDREDIGLNEATTVKVWFSRGETPEPVYRRVRGAPLDGALRALVLGPTGAEREDGLGSWFSEETRRAIRRIQAGDGDVVVDFRDLPDLIPGASSSAGSHQLLAALDSTVFQFDWVETAEYRLDGSCDAFWEWLQRGCQIVTRSGPVDPGDVPGGEAGP